MTPIWAALAVVGPMSTLDPSEPDKGEPTALEELVTDSTDSTGSAEGSSPNYLFNRPPALSALGNDATKFDEPGTPMDFAVSIGDFFTEGGALKAGGAVEVGARGLGLTRHVTADQYRSHYALRTLSHSYLSLASTKREVADADDDILLSVGMRTGLYHGGDPLIDAAYIEAVNAVEAECSAKSVADPELDPIKCREDAYPKLAVTLSEPRWNAPGVVLSGAFVGAWLGGRYTGFQAESASVWATGTLGMDEWGQIGLAAAWTQNLADGPNTFSPTLRFRGGFDGARITAEGAWLLDLPASGDLASRYRASVGGEFRVQGGSWVHGSFGLEFDPTDDLVTLLGGLSFRWGQASEPSFMPEPAATTTATTSTTGKAPTTPPR